MRLESERIYTTTRFGSAGREIAALRDAVVKLALVAAKKTKDADTKADVVEVLRQLDAFQEANLLEAGGEEALKAREQARKDKAAADRAAVAAALAEFDLMEKE